MSRVDMYPCEQQVLEHFFVPEKRNTGVVVKDVVKHGQRWYRLEIENTSKSIRFENDKSGEPTSYSPGQI